jgi:hypothetical protein
MAPDSHTRENQLLLCCARTQLDRAAKIRARQLIEKDLDWSYLLDTAIAHGVGPLLYKSLRAIDDAFVPSAAQARLRSHTQKVFVHGSLLAEELLNVLAAFEAQDLPAIPLRRPGPRGIRVWEFGATAVRKCGHLGASKRHEKRKRNTPLARLFARDNRRE